jgi:LysR family transcriptional regulator, transcriptional activator of nhaA
MKAWINYHHLQYFMTTATEGGVAKAAKKLRIGQPTLSTQLRQFEETIGHELFDRSKRQLQLTEMGQIVLGYAVDIFKLGDELLESLNEHRGRDKVPLQIGIVDSVAKHLARRIVDFAISNYKTRVTIIEGHADALFRDLKSHRVDIVVSNFPPSVGDDQGFLIKSIAKMPVSVCGAPSFAKLKKNFPNSLNGQGFVLPTAASKLRHDVDHYFKLQDMDIELVAEVQDTSLIKLMGIHGDGLITIPEPAVEDLIANKSLVKLGNLEGIFEELWFVTAQRRIPNPVAIGLFKRFAIT